MSSAVSCGLNLIFFGCCCCCCCCSWEEAEEEEEEEEVEEEEGEEEEEEEEERGSEGREDVWRMEPWEEGREGGKVNDLCFPAEMIEMRPFLPSLPPSLPPSLEHTQHTWRSKKGSARVLVEEKGLKKGGREGGREGAGKTYLEHTQHTWRSVEASSGVLVEEEGLEDNLMQVLVRDGGDVEEVGVVAEVFLKGGREGGREG